MNNTMTTAPNEGYNVQPGRVTPDQIWSGVPNYSGPNYELVSNSGSNDYDLDIGSYKIEDGKVVRKRRETPVAKLAGLHSDVQDNYMSDGITLWNKGDKIVRSDCLSIVEPNYSLSLFSPRAYVLWVMYKKRWLSRYWQEWGIRVWVDLNCPIEYKKEMLLGVPVGWRSYATRGYVDKMDELELEWELAKAHSTINDPLFLVIGGSKLVKAWALERGSQNVIWMPEEADIRRGRIDPGKYTRQGIIAPQRQRLPRPQLVIAKN